MAGRVDQVQVVGLAVGGPVLDPHRLRLDRDPALALEVHRVEHLGAHLLRVDGPGDLEDAVGQGRLAVVDVGDDREVADVVHGRAEYGEALGRRVLSRGRGPRALRLLGEGRCAAEAPRRLRAAPRAPRHPLEERHHGHADGSSGPVSLKTTVGGLRRMTLRRGLRSSALWRVGGLAGFDAVAAGDDVVVVAGVEEAAPGAAGRWGYEAAVGRACADELDVVGEVGAEQGVLAGAGGGDAGVGDRAGPLEGGVQARGGEGGVRVAVLQVVALDRVADRDPTRRAKAAAAASIPPLATRIAGLWPMLRAPSALGVPSRLAQLEGGYAAVARREQRQAEDQRRGQVAQAGLEAAGHPSGPRPRSGRSARRGRPRGRRAPATRSSGLGARGRGRAGGRRGPARRAAARRARGRGAGRAGTSPTRSSRRSGSRGRCAFAAARAPARRRQRDRAEVVNPGQRVAGVDEVAQVPVAAAGQRGEASRRKRAPAAVLAARSRRAR